MTERSNRLASEAVVGCTRTKNWLSWTAEVCLPFAS